MIAQTLDSVLNINMNKNTATIMGPPLRVKKGEHTHFPVALSHPRRQTRGKAETASLMNTACSQSFYEKAAPFRAKSSYRKHFTYHYHFPCRGGGWEIWAQEGSSPTEMCFCERYTIHFISIRVLERMSCAIKT